MTLFDPGLQPERTALAWRRSGLGMAVGALAALRVLPLTWGVAGFAVAAAALALAIAIIVASHARYRRETAILLAARGTAEPLRVRLSGGALPAFIAASSIAVGIAALALVLARL